MTHTFRKHDRHSECGVALLVAIFTLLLITAIGAGMIMLTNTDTITSANFRDEQTALFGAKAGIEEVRDRMRTNASNSLNGSFPTAVLGNPSSVLYVLNPTNGEADTPWAITPANAYPDTEYCGELTRITLVACPGTVPGYTTQLASASYAIAGVPPASWKWTRVNLKTNLTSSGTTSTNTVDGNIADKQNIVCWTGSGEIATPLVGTPLTTCSNAGSSYLPVYVMTTLAVTPSGSRRMMQAETAALTFPTLPGAMIFDGPTPVYGAPNSNAFGVSGNDIAQGPNAGAGCPAAANEPAVGAYNAASVTALTTAIPRPGSYTGIGGSPSVANVSTALGPLATVGGLEALQSQVMMMASPANIVYGNAGGITNPGTNAAPVINVVTGDLTLGGGFSGSGILLVEGNLTMSGNPSYNGLILVIGKGTMTKNGGGNGTLNGSLLVANLYDNSGIYTPAHLLLPTGAPGIPNLNWNGGGNAGINYDSCWSSALSKSLNYRIVAVREMMY